MNDTLDPEQDILLRRGVAEVIDAKSLTRKLHRGKPLRVKLGIDPTGYQLHLGHAVPLRKLRALQGAGHKIVLIIGDYTAQVGDPSGKEKTRTVLSETQVAKFSATYLEQIGRILDLRQTEVRRNSEWFSRFSAADFLRLMSHATVNQLLAHETFRSRMDRGLPLGVHELTYPILQGYDSVAVEADLELGGIDQKFNVLAGRDIQKAYDQEPQDVMLFDYLIGTDGKEKMSKTANNLIALDDAPREMFGKTMSLPDKLVPQYFELATDVSLDEVAQIKKQLRSKKTNPRDVKIILAKTLVTMYHGEREAEQAAFEFTRIFRKGGTPSDIPTVEVRRGAHPLLNLLVGHQLATSRSEARRLVEQGGVKIDQQVVTDWEAPVMVQDGMVLQVGKRKFVKLSVTS